MAEEVEGLVFRVGVDDTGRLALKKLDAQVAATAAKGTTGATKMKGAFASFGGQITTLLPLLGVGAGLAGALALVRRAFTAISTAIKDTIKTQLDFEHTMSKVKAITGASGDAFKGLTQIAKELGATTVFTARQVAEAEFTLAKAGFKVKEIVGALKPTLSLAAAGGLEMAEAAGIASDVMRGMNLEVSDLQRAIDVLTATATSSNQSIQDVGEAMKFAATGAQLAGIQIEEVSAALAILANRGLRASIAGTGLRRTIAVMAGDLSEGEKGVGALGASLFDAEGKSVGLANSIDILAKAGIVGLEGLTTFGARAGNVFAVLSSVGSDTLRDLTDEFKNVAGITEKIEKENLNNLYGATVRFSSAAEGLRIELGEAVNPILRALIDDGFTPLIRNITMAIQGSDKLKLSILDMAISVVQALKAIAGLADSFGQGSLKAALYRETIGRVIDAMHAIELASNLVRIAMVKGVAAIAGFIGALSRLPVVGFQFEAAAQEADAFAKKVTAAMLAPPEGDSLASALQGIEDRLTQYRKDLIEGLDPKAALDKLKRELAESQNHINSMLDKLKKQEKPFFLKLNIADPAAVKAEVTELQQALNVALVEGTPRMIAAVQEKMQAVRNKFKLTPSEDELKREFSALTAAFTGAVQSNQTVLAVEVADQMADLREQYAFTPEPETVTTALNNLTNVFNQALMRGSDAMAADIQAQMLRLRNLFHVDADPEILANSYHEMTDSLRRAMDSEQVGLVLKISENMRQFALAFKIDPSDADATAQVNMLMSALGKAVEDGSTQLAGAIQKELGLVQQQFKVTPDSETFKETYSDYIAAVKNAVEIGNLELAADLAEQLEATQKMFNLTPDADQAWEAIGVYTAAVKEAWSQSAPELQELFTQLMPSQSEEGPIPLDLTGLMGDQAETDNPQARMHAQFEAAKEELTSYLEYKTQWFAQYKRLLDVTGASTDVWSNRMLKAYSALGAIKDVLSNVLGSENKFAKAIGKIQGAILLVKGVQTLWTGLLNIATGIYPPNPPQIAAGVKQVAEGSSAISQAKQMGAIGGGGGGSASAGSVGGSTSNTFQAAQQTQLAREDKTAESDTAEERKAEEDRRLEKMSSTLKEVLENRDGTLQLFLQREVDDREKVIRVYVEGQGFVTDVQEFARTVARETERDQDRVGGSKA